MQRQPIFIHSLFRTGSTYLWNKFRQSTHFFCYYEPLHQDYALMSAECPDPWKFDSDLSTRMHFPSLNNSLTLEYHRLLKPDTVGLPLFRKSFSFDEYNNNRHNPDLKSYLDSLLENAGNRIPVLQFNRSALRIPWFKKHYPQALHLYLVRNPRDQFQSYFAMMQDNDLDIFLIMDQLIAGKNHDVGEFKLLASKIPLIRFNHASFSCECLVYKVINRCFSDWERYFIFYFHWFYAFFENIRHADFVFSIDLLSTDLGYRNKVSHFLEDSHIPGMDFQDAAITQYPQQILQPESMSEIELMVRSLFFQHAETSSQGTFFDKLHPQLMEALHIIMPLQSEPESRAPVPELESGGSRADLDKEMAPLAQDLIRHSEKLKNLHNELVSKKNQLFKLGNEVAELYRSSIKLGRFSNRLWAKIDSLDQGIAKINRDLRGHEDFVGKGSQRFFDRLPTPDGIDIRSVSLSQRYRAIKNEFERTNTWLEEKIQSLTLQNQLLDNKFELLLQREQILRS